MLVILLNVLPLPAKLARFLVDKDVATGEVNVCAAQNAMWVAFFWGLAELWLIHGNTKQQEEELGLHYLPEDQATLLLKEDMAKIHQCVRARGRFGMLAQMVELVADHFQSTGSVSNCTAIMNTNIELKQNEIDLQYNSVKYITWLLPSLGFIGTVWGILSALDKATVSLQDPAKLPDIIGSLSVAFWTTLLALLMACVMMLLTHIVKTREERLLNRCSTYCVKNLINRLLVR